MKDARLLKYLAIENNYPPSITIPHDFQSLDFCVKISSPCENNYPSHTSAPQAKNFGVLYENKYTETKIWRKSPHFLEILRFCVKISTPKIERTTVMDDLYNRLNKPSRPENPKSD